MDAVQSDDEDEAIMTDEEEKKKKKKVRFCSSFPLLSVGANTSLM